MKPWLSRIIAALMIFSVVAGPASAQNAEDAADVIQATPVVEDLATADSEPLVGTSSLRASSSESFAAYGANLTY